LDVAALCKGFHIFLRAAAIPLSKYRHLHIFAAGAEPGDARKEKSYYYRISAGKRVREGYKRRYLEPPLLPHRNLSNIFKITNVSFQPSIIVKQAMVMREMMANGCIAIPANASGIKESISSAVTGFLPEAPLHVNDASRWLRKWCERTLCRHKAKCAAMSGE